MAELDFSSRGTLLDDGGALDFSDESVEASARRPSVMDVAKQALIGFVPDTAQGLGWLLEKAGLDYGREMRRAGADTERDILESMTPGGRRAATTPMFEGDSLDDLGVTDKWGQSLIMGASRSLPQMAQMVIPGAAIAKGVSVIPGVAGLAKAPGVAGAAARYLPGALGFGAAEGLQAGALNAAQTQGEIEGSDPATLPAHSRRYRELIGEMDPAAAQRTLADEAASQVFRRTAPWTGAVGALTGGGALGGLVRPGRQSVLRAIAGGAGSEALQEAPQSGGERYIQNLAEREFVDERTDPWKQVVAEALTGGAIGGVTGGAVGGAGRVMRGRTVEGEVTGREITREIGAARDALGDVAQAQETERAVDTARRTAESLKAKAAALAIPPAKGAADEVEIQDATAADAAGAQARARGENALGDAAAGNADVAAGTGEEAQPGVLAGTVDEGAHEAAPSPINELPEPTEGQKDAGNYKKGHVKVGGLDVSIENPVGSKRRPEWPTLESHYGYVKGVPARAPDKDHVDVFVKPGTTEDFAGEVYVVDQQKNDGAFDEPKVMVGFASEQEAREAYQRNYTPDWKGARDVTAMPIADFRAKLQDPNAFMQPQRPEKWAAGAQPTKGDTDAKAVREDAGQVPAPGLERPGGEAKGGADLQRQAAGGREAGDQQAAQVGGELGDATQQLPAAGEQGAEQEPAAGEQRTEEPAAPAVQAPAGVERPQQVEKPKRLLPAERRARAAEEAAKRQAERTVVVPERDRNEAILSAPEGTAPPRDVSEQKVPTQQDGLFGNAITAPRTAADEPEKASGPTAQPQRTRDDVVSEIDALTEKADDRRRAAKDESIKALRPTATDWMTPEEFERYQRLQAELAPLDKQDRAAAQGRVRDKRATRIAAEQAKSEQKVGQGRDRQTLTASEIPDDTVITLPVKVEESGEVYDVEFNAREALRESNRKVKRLRALLDCIRG